MTRNARLIGSRAAPGEDVVDEGIFTEQGASAEDAQESAFDDLVGDSNADRAGMQIWCYRQPVDATGQPAGRGSLEWLFTVPVDGASLDQIFNRVRTEFMKPADDQWIIRVQVRAGNRGIKWNRLYTVRNARAAAPAPGAPGSPLGEVAAVVERMMAQQNARIDELAGRARPAQQGLGIQDILALQQAARSEMLQLMQMMRPAVGAAGPALDPIAQMSGMLEVMQKMQAIQGSVVAGGEGDGPLSTLRALAPLAMDLMKTLRAAQSGALAQSAPALAQSAPALAAPGSSQPPMPAVPEGSQNMWFMMREELNKLAEVAGTKPDVKIIADQILTPLPAAYDDQIYSMLSAGNWFESMTAVCPALAAHREWMTALRNELLSAFSDPEPAAGAAPGTPPA